MDSTAMDYDRTRHNHALGFGHAANSRRYRDLRWYAPPMTAADHKAARLYARYCTEATKVACGIKGGSKRAESLAWLKWKEVEQ